MFLCWQFVAKKGQNFRHVGSIKLSWNSRCLFWMTYQQRDYGGGFLKITWLKPLLPSLLKLSSSSCSKLVADLRPVLSVWTAKEVVEKLHSFCSCWSNTHLHEGSTIKGNNTNCDHIKEMYTDQSDWCKENPEIKEMLWNQSSRIIM